MVQAQHIEAQPAAQWESLLAENGYTVEELLLEAARDHILNYSKYMMPDMVIEPYHRMYYEVLNYFAHGLIKKLIISMPPQHGKSQGSSRFLPSYMLGLNPDRRIAIGSYSNPFAQEFNVDNQRLMDTPEYHAIFPGTLLSASNVVTRSHLYKRNSHFFECVGRRGSLRVVGVRGPLTGKKVDCMVMDDLYRDQEQGNSPLYRKRVWSWYTSVVRTRLNNNAQQLIVFTRWHEQDLVGTLEKTEQVIEITNLNQLATLPRGAWAKVNFPAIKEGAPTPIDPRPAGAALWPEEFDIEKLQGEKALDPVGFSCLYQGNPSSAAGQLYGDNFTTYSNPEQWGVLVGRGSYTDVADEGTDNLCTINYEVRKRLEGKEWVYRALVLSVLLTDKPVEYTMEAVPAMLKADNIKKAYIESNNGGRTFSVVVQRAVPGTIIKAFHQGKNKESRIITNAPLVVQYVLMPVGWQHMWPDFYKHVTTYLRDFEANDTDDPEDTLTGIVEKELLKHIKKSRKPKQLNSRSRRAGRGVQE